MSQTINLETEKVYCQYCKSLLLNELELEQKAHTICLKEISSYKGFADNKAVIEILEDYIENADYCKGSYFWSTPNSASQRRHSEEKYSRSVKKITVIQHLKTKDKSFVLEFSCTMSMSCRNAYFSKSIYKDNKETNLTVLKSALKNLKNFPEQFEGKILENN